MSAYLHANGGALMHDLVLPDFRDDAVDAASPATSTSEATRVFGGFLRDVVSRNPQTSASSAPTRRPRTALVTLLSSPTARGLPRSSRTMRDPLQTGR